MLDLAERWARCSAMQSVFSLIREHFLYLLLLQMYWELCSFGYIAGAAARRGLSRNLVLFLKTGVCGGFTTFSTFSLEAYNLFDGRHYITAVLYMILSMLCCLAGVAAGLYLAERMG